MRVVAGVGVLWGRVRVLTCVGLVAAAVVLVGSGSGSAGVVHPFVASSGAGSNPQAVAVDQGTGDVFVLDVGSASVLKFDAAGSPVSFSALGTNSLDGASGADLTPEGGFSFDSNSAAQVAVDSSGGATDGYVYVANSFTGVVDVFDSTGTFVGEIDGSGATPPSGGEVCGVAVDPAGDVYASYFGGNVDKYTPVDANPVHDTFGGQLANIFGSCNVAADGLGNIYVSSWPSGPLTRYDASQLGQPSASGTQIDATSLAVTVDPTTNDVYVDEGDHVAQYNSAGALIGQSGKGTMSGSSFGVGIKGSTGDLYASDAGSAQVHHFGPGIDVPAPAVTIDPPSGITSNHATFTGTVNPEGSDPLSDTTWHFEYSTDSGATWTPRTGGDAGTGTSPVSVSDELSTLLPNQDVQVRLVAANAGASTTSSVESFTTVALAPDATTQPAQDITPDHAVLEATLNAHHAQSTYFFEYGTTTNYGASIPTTQDGDAGSSPDTIGLVQSLYQLQPGTTYHYRIVANNLAGTTHGQDQTFTTTTPLPASTPRQGIPGTGVLPDNRGWEQASPSLKHGSDVMVHSERTRAAAGETPGLPMAVTFSSLGGFADVHGTGIATDYMAIRNGQPGTNGWTTHGITPQQNPLTALGVIKAFESEWENELSPDLTRGIYRSSSPLTDVPDVNDVVNLYRRDDLRTPGAGAYELLTRCPACSAPLPPILDPSRLPRFAGASADFGHVLFESTDPLIAGATSGPVNPNLYEWVDGTLRLAGILPDSACGSPPCIAPVSVAGRGTGGDNNGAVKSTLHTISADGSRIVFTDTSSGDANLGTGNLYMRINGVSTVQINVSEKASPDLPQPAQFEDASTDDSRVLFTTNEQLTDHPAPGGSNLYMYDVHGSDHHHLTLISAGHNSEDTPNGVQGVIGASADGDYVYFLASGQLVAGAPVGANLGVYEWHDGALSYVGGLVNAGGSNDEGSDILPNFWGFDPMTARVTPDGRHMLFRSSSGVGLTSYQSNGHAELYLYSADSHRLQCVSCNPSGAPATGDASDMSQTGQGAAGTASHLSHPVTDDGSRVFFTSTDALVPEDTNGKSDAYEFDTASGTVHLLSGGSDSSGSYFMDASANGNDAFFLTRQELVGWDTDPNYDLYDARVNGGLPDPPVSVACSGDPCHGSLPVAPEGTVPGSQTLQSAGNVKPKVSHAKKKPKAPKCKRGFVRKRVRGRVRCVKAPRRAVKRAGARRVVRVQKRGR